MLRRLILLSFISICFTSLNAQYLMPVYYARSFQPAQGGADIGQAIDGNDSTIYHSQWWQSGIPDTLTFYFSSLVPALNKLEYTPRPEGYNGIWSKIKIQYASKSDPAHYVSLSDTALTWAVDHTKKSFEMADTIFEPYAIRFIVMEASGDYSSCAEMRFWGPEPTLPDGSMDCAIDASTLNPPADIKIKPDINGSSASSFQPFENIEGSFDDDYVTLYHSNYGQQGTAFPIDLIYHFDTMPIIDYIIYYPRSDGNWNGYFGKTSIYYNTDTDSAYVHLTDFDFEVRGLPVKIAFPGPTKVNNIKFVIYNGGGGFASVAEMEFYRKAPSSGGGFEYASIFESALYTSLRADVTQERIDTISSLFYRSLAQCLFNGTYNHSVRAREYNAYESLYHLSARLKTSGYDAFENPTGILFNEGEKAVLFVSGTGNEPVYLRVRDFADEQDPGDHLYFLSEGKNVITMKDSGLAYISYYTDTPSIAPAVAVNIVTGRINGYFDPIIHSDADWVSLMSNMAYPKIDITGRFVHMIYDKSALKQNTPFNGSSLIQAYDTIVNWQKIQMGMYKYNYTYPNRIQAFSATGGGYYAAGMGIHLDLTWGPASITDPSRLDLWGIPHEFGHVNQIRPGLRWIGTTEVTNNIYAIWAYYNMNRQGEKYTRLESDSQPNGEGTQNWPGNKFNNFIDSTFIGGRALQDVQNDYPFRVLIPFWQLELYYQLAGASRGATLLTYDENPPVTGIDYAHWYATVAEKVRNTDPDGLDNGAFLLNFVRFTCDAVREDLSDFFVHSGFLKPIDKDIDDYGTGHIKITQDQIDTVIDEIKSKYANKPVSPVINYISSLSVNKYKDRLPLVGTTGDGVSVITDEGPTYLKLDHTIWQNAVAFETYDSSASLIHVTIRGTGDLTLQHTNVLYGDTTYQVYAVGYDGQRILVFPKNTSAIYRPQFKTGLILYPNPVKSGEMPQIMLENAKGKYKIEIFNLTGNCILKYTDEIAGINKRIHHLALIPGAYQAILSRQNVQYKCAFIVQ